MTRYDRYAVDPEGQRRFVRRGDPLPDGWVAEPPRHPAKPRRRPAARPATAAQRPQKG